MREQSLWIFTHLNRDSFGDNNKDVQQLPDFPEFILNVVFLQNSQYDLEFVKSHDQYSYFQAQPSLKVYIAPRYTTFPD